MFYQPPKNKVLFPKLSFASISTNVINESSTNNLKLEKKELFHMSMNSTSCTNSVVLTSEWQN